MPSSGWLDDLNARFNGIAERCGCHQRPQQIFFSEAAKFGIHSGVTRGIQLAPRDKEYGTKSPHASDSHEETLRLKLKLSANQRETFVNPEEVVQRQLIAYNAKDLDAFVAQYADDVREYRPPMREPFLEGRAAFRAYYGDQRFVLPDLHAEIVQRMVVGNKVVDHERIVGIRKSEVEGIALYEVIDGLICNVWFYSNE